MLDERPTAADLLAAVGDFLDREVLPQLAGHTGFHARVALNALRIVERELRDGPAAVAADLDRLRRLTGADGSLAELNILLAARIRAGDLAIDDPALREHLLHSVLARIAIDSPKYPSLAAVPTP